jgi:hypothetical protein
MTTIATERGFRVASGKLAPQDRDVLAASFLDLGRAMRREPAFGSMGRELLAIAAARLMAQIARRREPDRLERQASLPMVERGVSRPAAPPCAAAIGDLATRVRPTRRLVGGCPPTLARDDPQNVMASNLNRHVTWSDCAT